MKSLFAVVLVIGLAIGVFIVALEQDQPDEFEVDVEEGYALIKSLPFPLWEEPPLGTTIKVGRFRVAAGRPEEARAWELNVDTGRFEERSIRYT